MDVKPYATTMNPHSITSSSMQSRYARYHQNSLKIKAVIDHITTSQPQMLNYPM